MEAYSLDLRQRVLAAVDEGKLNRLQISYLFRVSLSWIRRLVQRRRETGEIVARQQRHGPLPTFTEEHYQQLRDLVRSYPDATLAELAQRLGEGVGRNTVWRALKKLGLTLKKSRSGPANRIVRTCSNNARSFVPRCK
jgi:transposase